MKICISFYVMVVIVADKLMISQCWLKHKASLSCLGPNNMRYQGPAYARPAIYIQDIVEQYSGAQNCGLGDMITATVQLSVPIVW